MSRALVTAAAIALALSYAPHAAALNPIGVADTFQSGTTEGWFAGGGPFGVVPPVPPHVVASGGPDGAGDAFLAVAATTASGPGSKLVAMNGTQWAGDYVTAGVTGIAMDLRNLGTTDLTIRLLFENPVAGPPLDGAVTTFGAMLPAGGAWTHVVFPVAPTDLTVLFGDVDTLMTGVTLIRLFHGTTAAFPGESMLGELGVDNIVAVPEPSTGALLLGGVVALAWYRGRSAARHTDR